MDPIPNQFEPQHKEKSPLSYYPQAIVRNSAFVVAAVVAAFFNTTLASIFAAGACAQILTFLAFNKYAEYDSDFIVNLKADFLTFQDSTLNLQLIMAVVMIVIFPILPILSGIMSIGLGIYAGFLSNANYYKMSQNTRHEPYIYI